MYSMLVLGSHEYPKVTWVTWSHVWVVQSDAHLLFYIPADEQIKEIQKEPLLKYLEPFFQKKVEDKVMTDSGQQRTNTQNSIDTSIPVSLLQPDQNLKSNKQVSMERSAPEDFPDKSKQLEGWWCVCACVVHACVCA